MFKTELQINGAGRVGFTWGDLPVMVNCKMDIVDGQAPRSHAEKIVDTIQSADIRAINEEEWATQAKEDIMDRKMEQFIYDLVASSALSGVQHMSFMCGPMIILVTTYYIEDEVVEEPEKKVDTTLELTRAERELVSRSYDLKLKIYGSAKNTKTGKSYPILLDRSVFPAESVYESSRAVTVNWQSITRAVLEHRTIGFTSPYGGVSGAGSTLYDKVLRNIDLQLLEDLRNGVANGRVTATEETDVGNSFTVRVDLSIEWAPVAV